MQTVGVTDITVTYSRPAVKGRKGAIWGKQVPYGETWRTGANATTTIDFSTDVTVAGQKVPKGKYGLFTLPASADGDWKLMLNKTWAGNIGTYKADDNLFSVTVPVQAAPFTESFTFGFENVTETTADLVWMWEEKAMRIPIQVATTELTQANIDLALSNGRRNYLQAASYYRTAQQLDLALANVNKALAISEDAWGYWVKSSILADLGKTQEAIATAKTCIEWAQKENGPNSNFFTDDSNANIAKWSK